MGRKGSRRGAGATPAIAALTATRVAFEVHEYAHDPRAESYGLEAADALGVPPEQVFKTLLAAGDGGLVVGIIPVSCRLDLKALAAAVGAKRLAMADAAEAERVTGYVVGGVSPIGQRKVLPTVLDESASRFGHVFVSAGRRGLEVSIGAADLLATTRGRMATISR